MRATVSGPWYAGTNSSGLLRKVVETYSAWPDEYRVDDDTKKTFPVMLTFGSLLVPLAELRRMVREDAEKDVPKTR